MTPPKRRKRYHLKIQKIRRFYLHILLVINKRIIILFSFNQLDICQANSLQKGTLMCFLCKKNIKEFHNIKKLILINKIIIILLHLSFNKYYNYFYFYSYSYSFSNSNNNPFTIFFTPN